MKFIIKIIAICIIINSSDLLGQSKSSFNIQNIATDNSLISKTAGICFRTDDNTKIKDLFTFADIFNSYNNAGRNYRFSLALNLAAFEFDSQDYIDSIKILQSMGHEIMDHTPNHRTNFFISKFDSLDYVDVGTSKPIAGVDHIIKISDSTHKVCLKYNDVQTTDGIYIGKSTISGDTLKGDFTSFDHFTEPYVYLEQLDTLLFISNFNSARTEAYLLDVWEDSVDFAATSNIDFYKLNRSKRLSIDAIKVLANETKKLVSLYGFQPFVTWIQPGGRHPIFNKEELKTALGGSLNYVAGASSFGESYKVYNEYDPNDDAKFGVQWGDFFEDHQDQTVEILKTKISDNIAKHKIQVGHNHFYTLTGDAPYVTMPEYFSKVDSLLAWCDSNNIDVNTYSQWTDSLYNRTPDPYENIIPPLNVNLDHFTDALNPNGVPDGYLKRFDSSHGELVTDPDAPSEGNLCFSTNSWFSRLFKIDNLGGIEKGENEFEIWTKGNNQNNSIEVIFSFPKTNQQNIIFEFPATSMQWTKYNLSQSLTSNKTLIIPDSISIISIEVKTKNNFNGPIKVSGMYLAKKKPTIVANLKVILQGAYNDTTNIMETDSDFQNSIPLTQPFNQAPWNYNGEESVQSIPQDVIDWVLVELRSDVDSNSVIIKKAGFVKKDGTVINTDGTNISFKIAEGSYYIVIYHRNHLSVMSATKVEFN